MLESIDIDKEAYNYHAEAKHQIEKSSAQNADVFTTVSEITGMEAAFVLKRKPDVLLPNGLDNDKFPTFEEASIQHAKNRERIKEFAMYYFFPYYQFNIKNTLLYFLAGRYELRNKGIDVFINALAQMNDRLKQENSSKTIIAFIFVPTGTRGVNLDILENRALFSDIKESLTEYSELVLNNVLYDLAARKELTEQNVFPPGFLEDTKQKVMKFKKAGNPPLITHHLQQYGDPIVDLLLKSGLDNMEDDRVKMIFYPIYLSGADGLLDMTYYEAMQGCHLGVFPSFYEPWGYTPLEAAALGVSSVTTDMAGFGRYIFREKEKEYPGVFVLKRMDRTDDEIVKDLASFMYRFAHFSKEERVKNKIEAKRIASLADWKILSGNYIEAHNLAISKKQK
jgi:glycogen(starch) synthase